MLNRNKKGMLFGLLIVLPTIAKADMFTPPDGDVFMQMLNQLFSKLLDYAGWEGTQSSLYLGTGSDPFQYMLEFVSYIAMILGTTMVSFAVIKSLLESATDGVPFTKDIGGWFYFTRTFFAAFFLAPIFSGYGAGQIIWAYFFTGSVGIAASEWQVFLEIAQNGDNPNTRTVSTEQRGNIRSLYAIKVPSPEAAEVTYKMFEGFTCMYGAASEKVFADYARGYNTYKSQNLQQANLNSADANALGARQTTIANNNGGVTAAPISVVPNNATTTGTATTMTGAVATSQVNEDAQRQAVRQQNEQNAQQMQDQIITADRNAYVQARGEFVNQQKLNEAYNFITTNGSGQPELMVKRSVYAFGLPVAAADTNANNGQTVVDTQPGYACGYIDFTNVGISSNRIDRYQERMGKANALAHNQDTSGPVAKKDTFVGVTNDAINKGITRKKEESSPVNDVVLQAYITKMNEGYRLKIQEIARDYVDEINQIVREVSGQNAVGALSKVDEKEANAKKSAALKKATQNLDTLTQGLEKEIIDYIMVNQYNQDGGQDNYMDFLKKAQESAKTEGAATAGMYFMSLQYSVAKIQSLTRLKPASSPSAEESTDQAFEELVGNVGINKLNNSVKNNIKEYYGFIGNYAGLSSYPVIFNKHFNKENDKGQNPIVGLALGIDVKNMADTARHPMLLAIESGHNIINSFENYEKQLAQNSVNNKQAVSMAMGTLVAVILGMGIMLAYFLPAIPLLQWLGSLMGLMFSFILMVFAIPIWLATHIIPEGSKYAGKGNAGYARAFSELIRFPALVFGLAASIICIQVFGIFALDIFARGSNLMYDDGLYASTGANTLSTIISSAAVYAILLIFLYQMLVKLMAFPNMLADGVPSFWGAPNGNTADFAQATGGTEAKGQVQQFGSAAGTVAGSRASSGATTGAAAGNAVSSIINEHQGAKGGSSSGSSVVIPSAVGSHSYTYNNAGGAITTSPPTAESDKLAFRQTADNAYKVASQSGYNHEEAQQLASQYASRGYANEEARQQMESYAKSNAAARELFEEMKESNGSIHMFTLSINDDVQYVQSNNNPATGSVPGNTTVTPSIQAASTAPAAGTTVVNNGSNNGNQSVS